MRRSSPIKTSGLVGSLVLVSWLATGCMQVAIVPPLGSGGTPANTAPTVPTSTGPLSGSVDGTFQPGTTTTPNTQPTVSGTLGTDLDQTVASFGQSAGGFSGSVLVAKDGVVLLDKGYGIADAGQNKAMPNNALWDWASVSKQFTSTGILKLRAQKKLDLDDPLSRFYQTPSDKSAITLRHLLTHTSGVNQDKDPDFGDFSREAIVAAFLSLPMAAQPGTRFDYCNMGYFVLAAVIEKSSGAKFEDFMVQNLFRPAGMVDSCFIGYPGLDLSRVPKEKRGQGPQFAYGYDFSWGYRGAGGAVVSTREMLVWDQALRGTAILDEESKQQLYTVKLENYALGWDVRDDGGETVWSHGGDVGDNHFHYLRTKDSRIVIAVATNVPSLVPSDLAAQLLARTRRVGA